MTHNFWTENTKIISFEDLVRLDLKNKIRAMENQIVDREHLAPYCYNYDYFISDKEKAQQFIMDYASDFIRTLNQYKKDYGYEYKCVDNPLKVVNLMVFYKARDIIKELDFVKANDRLIFDTDTKTALLEELDASLSPNLTVDRIFTDRENLERTSCEYIYDNFKELVGKSNIPMGDVINYFENPILDEKTATGLLQYNFEKIFRIAAEKPNVMHPDFVTFMQNVIYEHSKDIIGKQFDSDQEVLDDKNIERFEQYNSRMLRAKIPPNRDNKGIIIKNEKEQSSAGKENMFQREFQSFSKEEKTKSIEK